MINAMEDMCRSTQQSATIGFIVLFPEKALLIARLNGMCIASTFTIILTEKNRKPSPLILLDYKPKADFTI